uniref:Uncharacterized protein n=1 Tax=Cacopsylla melanoneura TaxID=428564 RepID=A0A8D8W573_9HEMI
MMGLMDVRIRCNEKKLYVLLRTGCKLYGHSVGRVRVTPILSKRGTKLLYKRIFMKKVQEYLKGNKDFFILSLQKIFRSLHVVKFRMRNIKRSMRKGKFLFNWEVSF